MTNIYAMQKGVLGFKHNNKEEMEKFIGLHIMMGVLIYPRIELYWSGKLHIKLFTENMSRNRFYQIRTNFYLVNNLDIPKDNTDKMRPLFNSIRKRCLELPLERDLCDDEQTVPFKGQHSAKMYNL